MGLKFVDKEVQERFDKTSLETKLMHVGSVVKFIGGSKPMTVESISDNTAIVSWFDRTESGWIGPKTVTARIESLEIVKERIKDEVRYAIWNNIILLRRIFENKQRYSSDGRA